MGRNRKKRGVGAVEAKIYDVFGNVIGETTPEPAATPPVQPQTVEAPAPVAKVNDYIANVTGDGLTSATRLSLKESEFNDLTPDQRTKMLQDVTNAADDISVKLAERILEQGAPRFGTPERTEFQNALSNVDELGKVVSLLMRADFQDQKTSPSKAEAERAYLPQWRDSFRSYVLREIRQAVRQMGDAAPAALRELRGQQRAVEEAIEFVPIAARNRAR